jgi:hypothetical protein
VGEARRRGGGTIYAAAKEPPELMGHVGWAALDGVSTTISPRCLTMTDNVAFCEGLVAGVFVSLFVLT